MHNVGEYEALANARSAQYLQENEIDPLLKGRIGKPRSVFTVGKRLRFNIVPMLLCVFIPFGFYVWVCGVTSFTMFYYHQALATCLVGVAILLAVAIFVNAYRARYHDPDPTWFSFLALMVIIMVIAGLLVGTHTYQEHVRPYLQLTDLKVANGVDASRAHGENFMDAGIIYFNKGNDIDGAKTHHFKLSTLYCVAPVITNQTAPESQSYDFWVVGKDCCAVGASDFRCGAWSGVGGRSGIRVMNDHDAAFYRLAVQQATTTYNIMAEHPIFFEWAVDPLLDLAIWNRRCYRNFLFGCMLAFIFCLFAMVMAAAKYAWIGRGPWKSGNEYDQDPRLRSQYQQMQYQPSRYP